MTERIYMSQPDVGELEEKYLLEALRSGWVAPVGPMLDEFEAQLAVRTGREHAIALSSGTAALHLALLELGARPGTSVIVPTMTFAATANAVAYTGAAPVFVDCDPVTGNLDPGLLEDALRQLSREGQSVAAIVPVDLLGKCADYTAILPIAERFGVPVLSDAAEALGASHAGREAGSFGVAAALSFNGNKIITTSGGGALVTDDAKLAARVRYLSTQARQPEIHYEHNEIGYNYRLSNLLAAVGVAQLQRLDEMIGCRRAIRDGYRELFSTVPGAEIFQSAGDERDNCWLTAVIVDPTQATWTKDDLAEVLRAANIESRPLWKPMHLQPVFHQARRFISGAAQRLFENGLTLPSGSTLSEAERGRVLGLIGHVVLVKS